MLTLTSEVSLPKTRSALTLAEFRDRAVQRRPVVFFEIPDTSIDHVKHRGSECCSGVATPTIWKGNRPGLMGYGPIPGFVGEHDKLLSIKCRTSILSFFKVDDTPVIPVTFKHEHRLLPEKGQIHDIVVEKALMLVLPEIPAEVDFKGVCMGVLVRGNNKLQVVRVTRSWFDATDHKVISGYEDEDGDIWNDWPMFKLSKLILKITGLCVGWTKEWSLDHDRVRRRRAKNLSTFKMPTLPDDATI